MSFRFDSVATRHRERKRDFVHIERTSWRSDNEADWCRTIEGNPCINYRPLFKLFDSRSLNFIFLREDHFTHIIVIYANLKSKNLKHLSIGNNILKAFPIFKQLFMSPFFPV